MRTTSTRYYYFMIREQDGGLSLIGYSAPYRVLTSLVDYSITRTSTANGCVSGTPYACVKTSREVRSMVQRTWIALRGVVSSAILNLSPEQEQEYYIEGRPITTTQACF